MRKPAFCICKNKDTDQLCGNHATDQHLCFPDIDRTIPLLHKSEILSLYPTFVVVQPGLCPTWSETAKTGFLRMGLIRVVFISVETSGVEKDIVNQSPASKSSIPPRPPTRRGRTTETLSSRLNLPVVTFSHKLINSKWILTHCGF